MRKPLAAMLLLCTALIAAGVFIPGLTAAVVDTSQDGESFAEVISPVELEIVSSAQSEADDSLWRLALISNCYQIELGDAPIAMDADGARAAAVAAMQPYIEAGLFAWFCYEESTAIPQLLISMDNAGRSAYAWNVNFIGYTDNQELHLWIDDETGKALSVYYYSGQAPYTPDEGAALTAADIFLSQLGLPQDTLAGLVGAVIFNDFGGGYGSYDFSYDGKALEISFMASEHGFFVLP